MAKKRKPSPQQKRILQLEAMLGDLQEQLEHKYSESRQLEQGLRLTNQLYADSVEQLALQVEALRRLRSVFFCPPKPN